jgi:nitroreductase
MVDYTVHEKGTFARWKTQTLAKLLSKWQPNSMHPVPFAAVSLVAQNRFAVFHHPPTVIFPLMDKRGIGHPEIDLGIVGTNIVMAGHSLGLGTCWVGLSSFLNDSPEWRERLGVEDPYQIIEAISVGYSLGKPTRNTVSRETHETVWLEDGKKDLVH